MKRIDSVKNPQVKMWKKLHTKKERDKNGLFLVEGYHLVEEALRTKQMVKELIVSEEVDIPSGWDVNDVSLTVVASDIMKAISDTETPQGIAAVCYQQKNDHIPENANKILLIDAVQDPGNLGTMLRTADAAGVELVVVGTGSVDLYNSKVIRSTQGAIFHLPVIKGQLEEIIPTLKNRGISVYGTSLTNAKPYMDVQPNHSFALLVGNEGSGVADSLLEQTDENLYIPIYGKSESLNVAVAAGILLYYLRVR